jgi:hypothetical protein
MARRLLFCAKLVLALTACSPRRAPPPPPHAAVHCDELAFAARPGPRQATPLELVIAVNGATCHREPIVSGATDLSAPVGALCGLHFAPGDNRVEVRLSPRRRCGPPVARAQLRCAGPEPD